MVSPLDRSESAQIANLRGALQQSQQLRELYARIIVCMCQAGKTGGDVAMLGEHPAFKVEDLHAAAQMFKLDVRAAQAHPEVEDGEEEPPVDHLMVVVVEPKGEGGGNGILATPDRRIVTP